MTNFEDKIINKSEEMLSKIRVHEIGIENKDNLWHRISVEKAKLGRNEGSILALNFSFIKMSIIAGLILAVALSTGGVVAASNDARPGDRLFGVDLAVEKIQLKFANIEKKSELRLKFAAERQEEVKEMKEDRDENKGAEVSAEARAKQHSDLNIAIGDLEVFIEEEMNATSDAELKAALEDIIVILGSNEDIEIKRAGNKIKIESISETGARTKIDIKEDSQGEGNDEGENEENDNSGSESEDNSENENIKIRIDGSLDL